MRKTIDDTVDQRASLHEANDAGRTPDGQEPDDGQCPQVSSSCCFRARLRCNWDPPSISRDSSAEGSAISAPDAQQHLGLPRHHRPGALACIV